MPKNRNSLYPHRRTLIATMGVTSVIGSIVNRERKSSWRNKFIKGEQSPSAPMEGVIICYFIYFLYLTSIKKKSSCVRNLFILIPPG